MIAILTEIQYNFSYSDYHSEYEMITECKFEKRLKELRQEKGLLQAELAEIMRVSNSAVSGWEIGRNRPSYEILMELAVHFETSIDFLLG